jgi:hypothetical protein
MLNYVHEAEFMPNEDIHFPNNNNNNKNKFESRLIC